jgi:hypothetical protein
VKRANLADIAYHGPDDIDARFDHDVEREPTLFRPRERLDLRRRRAFQAGVIDSVNRATDRDDDIARLLLCRGPVYAPTDSDRERIDCSGCGAVLVTRQGLTGSVLVELDAGNSTPGGTP